MIVIFKIFYLWEIELQLNIMVTKLFLNQFEVVMQGSARKITKFHIPLEDIVVHSVGTNTKSLAQQIL